MNALQFLKRDHDKVRRLFADFETAGDDALVRKQEIAEQVFVELQAHSRIEEELFYPALNAKATSHGKELVEEALDEHADVDEMIRELRGLSPGDDEFEDKFQELISSVEHHIQEEEGEMFPEAEKRLGSELEELGRDLEQERATIAS